MKVQELINLHQGGMSVQEYSLKFTKFSKYAPLLVFNPRDEMIHFVTRVCDDLVEECRSVMLYENTDISWLIVHGQQVQETRLKRNNM